MHFMLRFPFFARRHGVDLILERQSYTPAGTFGFLWMGETGWWTMEEPWRGNEVGRSCIPTGTYDLEHVIHNISTPGAADDYPAYGLVDVPGRTAIHIHIGNTIEDIAGCILLGKGFGMLDAPRTGHHLPAVLTSGDAFREFMGRMAGQVGTITIKNACPDEFEVDWRGVYLEDRDA